MHRACPVRGLAARKIAERAGLPALLQAGAIVAAGTFVRFEESIAAEPVKLCLAAVRAWIGRVDTPVTDEVRSGALST